MKTKKQTPELCTIWFDTQDPANQGWAANVVVDGEHHSEPLPHRRRDVDFETLLASLRREWRTSVVEIPRTGWTRRSDGNGWEWKA